MSSVTVLWGTFKGINAVYLFQTFMQTRLRMISRLVLVPIDRFSRFGSGSFILNWNSSSSSNGSSKERLNVYWFGDRQVHTIYISVKPLPSLSSQRFLGRRGYPVSVSDFYRDANGRSLQTALVTCHDSEEAHRIIQTYDGHNFIDQRLDIIVAKVYDYRWYFLPFINTPFLPRQFPLRYLLFLPHFTRRVMFFQVIFTKNELTCQITSILWFTRRLIYEYRMIVLCAVNG